MSYQPNQYEKKDVWIQTYSGESYPLLDPHPDFMHLDDIAHALSNQCRFAGHVRRFYSTAQHSVLCSYHVPPEDALTALLHDASEAYLVDIPRPLKRSGLLQGYLDLEEKTEIAVAQKFGLQWPMPPSVKEADVRALLTEQRDLLGRQAKPWKDTAQPFEKTILPLPPEAAEEQFLARFKKLIRERKQNVVFASKVA